MTGRWKMAAFVEVAVFDDRSWILVANIDDRS